MFYEIMKYNVMLFLLFMLLIQTVVVLRLCDVEVCIDIFLTGLVYLTLYTYMKLLNAA